MNDLRPRKKFLKPSPTTKGLPDMCEKLAKTCVLNYPGGLWLSQQSFAISWDPVKQKLSLYPALGPIEWGTYSKRICVLGPALEDTKVFQLMTLNSMEHILLQLYHLKRLHQLKNKCLNCPPSVGQNLTGSHFRISPVFPTIYYDCSTEVLC